MREIKCLRLCELMLSVLIPTYNYSALDLVKSLHKQLDEQNIVYEVICFDNGSNSEANIENDKINDIQNCYFEVLKKDGGRSRIKNLLARKSIYPWLLFLDSDVLPVSKNFIQNYADAIIAKNEKVFYGGLKYYNDKPADDKILRWVYGMEREEIPLKKRNLDPQNYFTAANFLIDKNLFEKIKFDESLLEYGHEDTLFALELKKRNIAIAQIDNPVFHLGLDKNEVFIEKVKKSIENLNYLHQQGKFSLEDNKLLKFNNNLKKMRMNSVFSFLFDKYSKTMELNLTSKSPSLLIFDLYKIGYLCSLRDNSFT